MSPEKRMMIAVAISFVVIVVWTIFFSPKKPPVPEVPVEQVEQAQDVETNESAENPEPAVIGEEEVDPSLAIPAEEPIAEDQIKTVKVETSRFVIEFTNEHGGSVSSWRVKKPDGSDYMASFSNEPLDLIAPKVMWNEDFRPFATYRRDVTGDYHQLPGLPMIKGDLVGDELLFEDGKANIYFDYSDPEFGRVTKTFTFTEDSYVIQTKLDYDLGSGNKSSKIVMMMGPGVGELVKIAEDTAVQPGGEMNGYILRTFNSDIQHAAHQVRGVDRPKEDSEKSAEEIQKEKTEKPEQGKVKSYLAWAGLENKYFMTLAFGDRTNSLVPVYQIPQIVEVQSAGELKYFSVPYIAIAPEDPLKSFSLYVGPKDLDVLATEAKGQLKDVVSFGMFSFVSKPAYWVLQQLNNITNNYGFAIILLTLLINLILLPLIIKQRNAMSAMQKLQPQIKQLQAKYKVEKGDDIKARQTKKQKLNEEMMLLYKKENVNPMGGCLPLLIQMPVLISLFDMMRVAIELRKAPFIFWWTDLSAPDPTYVLPILMSLTMFFSQKITPAPAESSTNAMKFLPFIFFFLFMSAPSGLVLYWFVSSLINVVIQIVMQKVNPMTPAPAEKEVIDVKNKTKRSRGKK